MSNSGHLGLALRTAGDVLIGIVLFVGFILTAGAYERSASATHHLGQLSISSSAGDLLKFSLDDSPLMAAAVVATAVPVPQAEAVSALTRTSPETAFALLAAIFSALVAFNLAFFRHLCREYASPR